MPAARTARRRARSRRSTAGGGDAAPWWAVRQRLAAASAGVRDLRDRAADGDRPLLAGLVALLAICVVMLSGPLQAYWDGHSRVDLLQRKHDALAAEVARLEVRRELLQDPAQIELLAREEQGFVRPGEQAYVVVPPDADEPRIERPDRVAEPPAPWYQRWWRAVARVLG